ncbi:hypothetical protein BDD12DRAFT_902230 [Trichophaea hybrida]|nr:hypothetical protein BDD12DRAFT_902230 [Trichophaea hybrida]
MTGPDSRLTKLTATERQMCVPIMEYEVLPCPFEHQKYRWAPCTRCGTLWPRCLTVIGLCTDTPSVCDACIPNAEIVLQARGLYLLKRSDYDPFRQAFQHLHLINIRDKLQDDVPPQLFRESDDESPTQLEITSFTAPRNLDDVSKDDKWAQLTKSKNHDASMISTNESRLKVQRICRDQLAPGRPNGKVTVIALHRIRTPIRRALTEVLRFAEIEHRPDARKVLQRIGTDWWVCANIPQHSITKIISYEEFLGDNHSSKELTKAKQSYYSEQRTKTLPPAKSKSESNLPNNPTDKYVNYTVKIEGLSQGERGTTAAGGSQSSRSTDKGIQQPKASPKCDLGTGGNSGRKYRGGPAYERREQARQQKHVDYNLAEGKWIKASGGNFVLHIFSCSIYDSNVKYFHKLSSAGTVRHLHEQSPRVFQPEPRSGTLDKPHKPWKSNNDYVRNSAKPPGSPGGPIPTIGQHDGTARMGSSNLRRGNGQCGNHGVSKMDTSKPGTKGNPNGICGQPDKPGTRIRTRTDNAHQHPDPSNSELAEALTRYNNLVTTHNELITETKEDREKLAETAGNMEEVNKLRHGLEETLERIEELTAAAVGGSDNSQIIAKLHQELEKARKESPSNMVQGLAGATEQLAKQSIAMIDTSRQIIEHMTGTNKSDKCGCTLNGKIT